MIPANYPVWKSSRVIERINMNSDMVNTLVKVDPKTGNKKRFCFDLLYLFLAHDCYPLSSLVPYPALYFSFDSFPTYPPSPHYFH